VGVSDGLGFGDNTRAALITRGLAEITRLGVALGAGRATFAGLSGMGDLIVTCTSRHSRNRGVGERLGRGEKIGDILGQMKQVAEGIQNCGAVRELALGVGVEVPITEEVHAIVHAGKSPLDAVSSLLDREMKPE
jgi:glycerol-3-phosphate dehydrogenase (NAD(P)+)